jgi:dTDP-glucose 4,6-dehydratase
LGGTRIACAKLGNPTYVLRSRNSAILVSLLVTGGAGFIGANFFGSWRARNPTDRLVVLDALTSAGNRSSVDELDQIEFVHGDILDAALVQWLLQDHAIDTVLHFAAESQVDCSIDGLDAVTATNISGTHSLLEACKAEWLDRGAGRPHRFHHISTDEVYGSLEPNDPPFSEQRRTRQAQPIRPQNRKRSPCQCLSSHLWTKHDETNCSNNYALTNFLRN